MITDDLWQKWANELRDLQAEHDSTIGFYDKEFSDWDGSTGMFLPADDWVIQKSLKLIQQLEAKFTHRR